MSNQSFEAADKIIEERFGIMSAYRWAHDPKTILFVLARYKFVAKMLAGYGSVLEVGCADGFGSRIVRQAVGNLTAIDIDAQMIEDAKKNASEKWPIEFRHGSMDGELAAHLLGQDFDAAYCLDVLEHVPPSEEHAFLRNLRGLAPVAMIGMPSLESQKFASPFSAAHHVNCLSGETLRKDCLQHWGHVFMFAQNDELVHTGHFGMAHYLFALCVA